MVRYRSGTDQLYAWLGYGGLWSALGRAGRESFAHQFSRDKGGDTHNTSKQLSGKLLVSVPTTTAFSKEAAVTVTRVFARWAAKLP